VQICITEKAAAVTFGLWAGLSAASMTAMRPIFSVSSLNVNSSDMLSFFVLISSTRSAAHGDRSASSFVSMSSGVVAAGVGAVASSGADATGVGSIVAAPSLRYIVQEAFSKAAAATTMYS
jgi:hypothetical protein